MPDRPVTPEQTIQPVTDRPDDLVAEARALVANGGGTTPEVGQARLMVQRLADALEAAQKERDRLARTLRLSDEDHDGIVEFLEARVRQLEEVLTEIERCTAGGTPATPEGRFARNINKIAREVLAAKENTTP